MEQLEQDVNLGRFLSLVLRHDPAAAHIELDAYGWADVKALLCGARRAGKRIDKADLERIVKENNKQRYSFNEDHSKIRANQGHSILVDVELQPAIPPERLYHGTAQRFLSRMRVEGIMKQSRQYVHLSVDLNTARNVGKRHGNPVVLPINTEAMVRDGCQFYLSHNGVWLCEHVSWNYVLEDEIM